MMRAPRKLEDAIAGTLAKCASRVRTDGPAAWRFELGNGKPLPAAARWEEPWLLLRAPLALPPDPEAPWRLLLLNGRLSGPARVVHPEGNGHFELQADLPVADVERMPHSLELACASLQRAAAAASGTPPGPAEDAPAAGGGDVDPAWIGLAGERGWTLERREAGRYAVELDAPGLQSQAWVEQQGGELSMWLEISRGGALSGQARRAGALFLLTLTGRLRMVRGAVAEPEPQSIRLEVRLPESATAAELDLALATLSLGCRRAAREVRALADDVVARTYLNHLTMKEE